MDQTGKFFKVRILRTPRLDSCEFEDVSVDDSGNISRNLQPGDIIHMAVVGAGNIYSFYRDSKSGRVVMRRNLAEIGDFSYGRGATSPQAVSRLEGLVGSINSDAQRPIRTKLFLTAVPVVYHDTEPGCYDIHKKSLLNVVVVSGNLAEAFSVRVSPRLVGGFAIEKKSLFTFPMLYPLGSSFDDAEGREQVVRESLQKFTG